MFGLSSCKTDDNTPNPAETSADGNVQDTQNNSGNSSAAQTGAGYTPKEIVDAIIAAYPATDMPEMQYYYSGVDESSQNYLDPNMAGMLINSAYAPVPEFDYLLDYALDTPVGNHVFEVDVLRVKDVKDLDAVKGVLDSRMKTKNNGNIAFYVPEEQPLLDNAKVMTTGSYAILLATTDNSIGVKVINNMLNSTLQNSGDNSVLDNNATESLTGNAQTVQGTTASAANVNMPEQVVNVQSQTDIDFNLFTTEAAATQASAGLAVTATPIVDVHMYSFNTSYFIAGTCEPGAKIRVTGGTEEWLTNSNFGNFFVEIPFAETGVSTLKLTAITDGKLPSKETTFIVKPQKDVTLFDDGGIYGNIVGYNHQYFCEDSLASFEGDDVLKDSEVPAIQTRMEKKIKDLRDKGCNAEIVFLLVPNPMRVYPEDAPTRYTENTGTTLRQQWEGAVTAAGATVVDLTDLFMQHKNDDFKIFQQTDTHWTEYGAMLGYNALMSYIGQKFPDALPRPSSDFEVSNKEFNWGDMFSRFNLQPSDLKDTTAVVKFNFDVPGGRVDLYQDGNCLNLVHALVSMAETLHTNLTGNFPSVYIYRDSFAGPFQAFISDRFSTAYYTPMWDYTWRLNDIVKQNPDYVLYIINERNIPAVLYN